MPVVGLVVAVIPIVVVLALRALLKALLLPFSALRQLARHRAARA